MADSITVSMLSGPFPGRLGDPTAAAHYWRIELGDDRPGRCWVNDTVATAITGRVDAWVLERLRRLEATHGQSFAYARLRAHAGVQLFP